MFFFYLCTETTSTSAPKKRRPHLLKRKAITTSLFDSSRKDGDKGKSDFVSNFFFNSWNECNFLAISFFIVECKQNVVLFSRLKWSSNYTSWQNTNQLNDGQRMQYVKIFSTKNISKYHRINLSMKFLRWSIQKIQIMCFKFSNHLTQIENKNLNSLEIQLILKELPKILHRMKKKSKKNWKQIE